MAYFFPQQGEKSFVFQEGRPWAYSLLTAPFDIPIYKDEARLAYERDSLMNDVRPIFYKDNTITTDMLNGFESELNALSEATLSNKDKKNFVDALQNACSLIEAPNKKSATTFYSQTFDAKTPIAKMNDAELEDFLTKVYRSEEVTSIIEALNKELHSDNCALKMM